MSENMSAPDHRPDKRLDTLYSRWAKGGAGLLITGNIMIDSSSIGEPCNVVVERGRDHSTLRSWARAGTQNGAHLWAQLNHPGKQTPKFLVKQPVAPSAIPLSGSIGKYFNKPRELREEDIHDLIARFAYAAGVLKEAGFTGIQIHGAHGYLVSQFLSPLHNQRTDVWGGSLENRMRFAMEVYRAIRKEVGPAFPVGIKLNSADFQKGGFTEDESIEVVRHLSAEGIDLIEVSGGTYEAQEMTGTTRKASTRAREAYFLDFCEKVRKTVQTPLMLTGGFRSLEGMNVALKSGACDVVGLARSLAVDPEFPNRLLTGADVQSEVRQLTTGWQVLDKTVPLEVTWYTQQLHLMGAGKNPKPKQSATCSIFSTLFSMGWQNLRRVRSK